MQQGTSVVISNKASALLLMLLKLPLHELMLNLQINLLFQLSTAALQQERVSKRPSNEIGTR
jgi:hypothetical protein